MPGWVRVALVVVAVIGFGWALIYFVRFPQVRAHHRPILAAGALVAGVAAVLALTWSPWVARGLGRFVVSPGLGSVAALSAAALALYGVFRQLRARQAEQEHEDEQDRADKYADHFRWVVERVLESSRPEDIPVINYLITDLGQRSPDIEGVEAATALLELHEARLKEAAPGVDADSGGQDS